MAALPYFDEIDPSTVDVLLITQYVFSFFFFMMFTFMNYKKLIIIIYYCNYLGLFRIGLCMHPV